MEENFSSESHLQCGRVPRFSCGVHPSHRSRVLPCHFLSTSSTSGGSLQQSLASSVTTANH